MNAGRRDGAAALVDPAGLRAVCAEERVTRSRRGDPGALPVDALALLMRRASNARASRYAVVDIEDDEWADGVPVEHIGHLEAHAAAAYYTSPFSASAVVVCDRDHHADTVWLGAGATLTRVDWPSTGPGFAAAHARIAAALDFGSGTYAFESLARLQPDARDASIDALFDWRDGRLTIDEALEARLAEWADGGASERLTRRASAAAAAQSRLAELMIVWLGEVQSRLEVSRLCLGGTLFHNSYLNTRVRSAGVFADVFIPVDPGNVGLAVGAALHGGAPPALASPFLGPDYSAEDLKHVLDNCKLQYRWESDGGIITAVAKALSAGQLVGWFDGRMEWGPRALGARCILANPFQPYVLENLNRFLKQREPWRGYALSGTEAAVHEHLDGPAKAPFMECDYRPRDPARFSHVLPTLGASVRAHTVADSPASGLFPHLLDAFASLSGAPLLVNTSFNGFHEPIVCSPRDAVRVFYGSGLDVLAMPPFLLTK